MRQAFALMFLMPAAAWAAGFTSTEIHSPAPDSTRDLVLFGIHDLSGYGAKFGCHEAECKGRSAECENTSEFGVGFRVALVNNRVGHCAAAGLHL